MAYAEKDKYFTAAEYLAFEREATTKHEFIDGLILDMAGGGPIHNRICFNLITSVGIQLRGTSCLGFTADQKVRTESEDLFYYPDLSIVYGEPIYHDKQQDVLLNPLVIIEVLSPITEEYDRSDMNELFFPEKPLRSVWSKRRRRRSPENPAKKACSALNQSKILWDSFTTGSTGYTGKRQIDSTSPCTPCSPW